MLTVLLLAMSSSVGNFLGGKLLSVFTFTSFLCHGFGDSVVDDF